MKCRQYNITVTFKPYISNNLFLRFFFKRNDVFGLISNDKKGKKINLSELIHHFQKLPKH